MTQHPPPHAPPPYAGPHAVAARPRPRRRWFVLGGTLLLLAAVVFVGGLVTTMGRSTDTDVVTLLRGPGQPVGAGVPVGDERMIFVPQGRPAPECQVTDDTGAVLDVRPATGSTTVTTMGVTWVGVATFTSPTAEVSVECATPVEQLRIGSPLGAEFAVGLALTVLGPLLLGGAGLAVLVLTTVLWFSRPPRPASAPPPPSSPSPGW